MSATLMALLGIAVSVVIAILRNAHSRDELEEPDSVVLWQGPRNTCERIVDLLADAGVAGWIERGAGEDCALHVDAEQRDLAQRLVARDD